MQSKVEQKSLDPFTAMLVLRYRGLFTFNLNYVLSAFSVNANQLGSEWYAEALGVTLGSNYVLLSIFYVRRVI